MGKNVSIYLSDEQINFISRRKEGASQVIQKALTLIMRADKDQQGYDDVLAAARTIGKSQNIDDAIRSWHHERDTERW
jgi:hypothetical protein